MAQTITNLCVQVTVYSLVVMILVNGPANGASIGSASQARKVLYKAMWNDFTHFIGYVYNTEQDFWAVRGQYLKNHYVVPGFVLDRPYDSFTEKDNLAFNIHQLGNFYRVLQQMTSTEKKSPQKENIPIASHFEIIENEIRGLIVYMRERERQAGFPVTAVPTDSPQLHNTLPTTQSMIYAWEWEVMRELRHFLTNMATSTLKMTA